MSAARPERRTDPDVAKVAQQDQRDETEDERMDRNWIEILQELRVVQTGTQILTGFLLTTAFQPRFDLLTNFQRVVYLCLVIAAALTTALGLAPVNLHRGLFRRHSKALVVRVGHQIMLGTLAGVGLVLVGTVLLIFDVVLGRTAALTAAGGLLLVLVAIGVLPLLLRASKRYQGR